MAYFEKEPTIEPSFITAERRAAIGSHVIAIGVMSEISSYLAQLNELKQGIVFNGRPDSSAKLFFDTVHAGEYARVRRALTSGVKTDSNAFIARYQMGLTTRPLKDPDGNFYFKPNSDFIVATHYLEDTAYAEKLAAQTGIDDLLEGVRPEFEAFYADRGITNIKHARETADLREIISRTLVDAEFYLEH